MTTRIPFWRTWIASALLLLPTGAEATIHRYTITGVATGITLPADYTLVDPAPVVCCDPFLLTFDLDDSAPAHSPSSNHNSFPGAVSNVDLAISDGLGSRFLGSGGVTEDVLGGNHVWVLYAAEIDGLTTLPRSLVVEDTTTHEELIFDLSGLAFALLDPTGSLFAESPPELVVFDPDAGLMPFASVHWIHDVDLGFAARFEVQSMSVTVPEPGAAGLTLAAMSVLAIRRRRR